MTSTHKSILKSIEEYLDKRPEQRFGQALFTLGINQFAKQEWIEGEERVLRDIYEDKDEDILARILSQKFKHNL